MATIVDDDQSVQYVQLLDVPVYDDGSHEIITIAEDDAEMPQVITMPDAADEVEYIEAEELDEEHTIIVHEGKQYVIPTEQLHQAGNTIVLEDDDEETSETHYVEEENSENIYYEEVDSEETKFSGQYAVLKDGKLHMQEDQSEEMQQKLRALENTLNDYEEQENEENQEEKDVEMEESSQDEDNDALSQITGKNLITGQTISLSGFLDKIRRKGIGEVSAEPQTRRGSSQQVDIKPQLSSEYVSVPPVNTRVVVGKTPDGRKLIGRILQIQKKVDPAEALPPVPRRQRQPKGHCKPARPEPSAPMLVTSQGASMPQCSALLDENVSRTLAGLMDLESVSKSLAGHKMIVRHVQRRSVGGRALPGTRKVAYYSGKMGRGPTNNWEFHADPVRHSSANDGIDLREEDNNHQVKLKMDEDGVVFSAAAEEDVLEHEPITVYLTVTQDEFGKKRTKVSIPQLAAGNCNKKVRSDEASVKSETVGGGHMCHVCGKKFQTPGSLRRHQSVHDPSLRPLQCLTCLARFTDESSLKKHLVLHSGVRPHACTVCNKSFAHRGDLNFHARTHDPVKRFRCETCGKQFHRHSNMLRHADIHRQVTVVPLASNSAQATDEQSDDRRPPFTCDTCGCQYNFISSLTRHIVNNHMTAEAENEIEGA